MGSIRLGLGPSGWDGVQQVEMGSSRLGLGPAGWDGV